MDFVKTMRPDTSQRGLVFTGRVATVVALVVAILWAPFIGQFDTLYQYLQSVLSFLVPPVVAVFLAGIASKRISATAAFLTLIIMQPLGLVAFILTQVLPEEPTIQFLYAAGLSLLLSVLLLIGISLLGPSPDEDKTKELTWKTEYWTQESKELQDTQFWANYRYLSVGLLILTAVIVVIWA
ncbi:sodium:solute symporter family transporter [Ornithinimicrobium sp. Y1847]|uniref:sodium:solute symporter family transporter n=1 Tax=Ornithinimicrobium sp. Y1847 TaxID=3405419 RepID=UPI003B6816E8